MPEENIEKWKPAKQAGIVILIGVILVMIEGYGGSFTNFHKQKLVSMEKARDYIGLPSAAIKEPPIKKRSENFPLPLTLSKINLFDSYFVNKTTSRANILAYHQKKMAELEWHTLKPFPRGREYRWCGSAKQGMEDVLIILSMPTDDSRIRSDAYPVFLSMKWTALPSYCG